MQSHTLHIEPRSQRGKGPARQLRMRGLIPAVIYGQGTPTESIAVSPEQLTKALSTAHGRNVVLQLESTPAGSGSEVLTMVKDLAIHPVSRKPLHADFYRIDPSKTVDVEVTLTTHGRAAGVQKGGKLRTVFRKLPIRTTPEQIPATIEVDVTHLDLNQSITVEQLKLPATIQVLLPPSRSVVVIGTEEKIIETEEEKPAAAAATPAAAAPAAAAKGGGKSGGKSGK